MSSDLREQLQASLAGSYTIERELGGGGMSQVFAAVETKLGRRVVVKVLHPDLAAGVNVDRFKREIALAAGLQHPCIVPVLNAGEAAGLPYYTMPFIESESLRARVSAVGMLPINEAVKVLREVASALGYAHERGIVHRDIKPDNVLLSGGYAVVTDFGIAKALSASKTVAPGGTITQLGTSVGTPAYMAPEQAAGDPNVDHRADIYSFGCMAYELLTGRTPFQGKTSHKLLAAQMSESPQSIAEQRPELPAALATVVMQCLQKDEGSRPQSAAEILQVLDAIGTPSGGGHDVRPAIAKSTRRSLVRALGYWIIAVLSVAILAKAAVIAIGLPSWTFPGALMVMAAGLPVILFTSFAQHGAKVARTMVGVTPGGSVPAQSTLTRLAVRASPVLSWRRTAQAGAFAMGAFVLVVVGYMVLRALGIGAVGSLFGKGLLRENDKVVIADFRISGADSSLGEALAEALRTDLSQSRVITVVSDREVRAALQRMRRPIESRVGGTLAREIALREGANAVIEGNLASLGGGFLISVRLLSPASGDVLTAFSEPTDKPSEVVAATGRLSHQLRAKIGESLKSVQSAPALDRVTTSSLPALQYYVDALKLISEAGRRDSAAALLRAAVGLDSNFAMAYRKLGVEEGDPVKKIEYLLRSYQLRDRLTPVERYLTEGTLEREIHDDARAEVSFTQADQLDSLNVLIVSNLAILSSRRHDLSQTIALLLREERADTNRIGSDAVDYLYSAGLTDSADHLQSIHVRRKGALHPDVIFGGLLLLGGKGQFDSISQAIDKGKQSNQLDRSARAYLTDFERANAAVRGHYRNSIRLFAVADSLWGGFDTAAWSGTNRRIWRAALLTFGHDTAAAIRVLDSGTARFPLTSIQLQQVLAYPLAQAYAAAGNPARARALMNRYEATVHDTLLRSQQADNANLARGWVAYAEGRPRDAIASWRLADVDVCVVCMYPEYALAYEALGRMDSARVMYERYLTAPDGFRLFNDALWRGPSLRRLGELYEANGEVEKAVRAYAEFVELWKDADPELQPQVAQLKKRIAQLSLKKR